MSESTCSKCKCMVGRSKLEHGSCKDIVKCIEMMKMQKDPEDEYKHTSLLNSKYFSRYHNPKNI